MNDLTPLGASDRTSDGSLELVVDSRRIRLTDDAANVLERLRVSGLLTVAEIIDQCREEIGADRINEALSSLINDGLVYVREPLRAGGCQRRASSASGNVNRERWAFGERAPRLRRPF